MLLSRSWQQLRRAALRFMHDAGGKNNNNSSGGGSGGKLIITNADRRWAMERFPPERIRNFSIIAHIDHGKSTLADRLLEATGVISPGGAKKQVLDKLLVEQQRGITVKAQTASLVYRYDGTDYLLNLIDTPGHVDFSYEVSSSLAACEGTLLVVDAAQGVQAQTLANFYLAFERDLTIIPVLNKIDLPAARIPEVMSELNTLFGMKPERMLQISAKAGIGIDSVLRTVIERIPPPRGQRAAPLKALMFDSWFDSYRGVVSLVRIHDGSLAKGDIVTTASNGRKYEVTDVGIMRIEEEPADRLLAGQVGYVTMGLKSRQQSSVGDTLYHTAEPVEPLPGFRPTTPMVFAGLFPVDQNDYEHLEAALEKLCLNDPSVACRKDTSAALGAGFRLGFLGMLHMEVFRQRLEQEHNADVVMTAPSVSYQARLRRGVGGKSSGDYVRIDNPADFPESALVDEVLEPMVKGRIIVPEEYLGKLIDLCQERRGLQVDMNFLEGGRVVLVYRLPLNEIVEDFYNRLKSISSGYASFEYEEDGYEKSDIVKVSLLLNDDLVDPLSLICHMSKAYGRGKLLCQRLKETIKRQLFEVAIQATVKNKIVARETVKALRKDVTAKCYGGDISRRMKLLNKQREGKKHMRMVGNVEVPKEAFLSVLSRPEDQ